MRPGQASQRWGLCQKPRMPSGRLCSCPCSTHASFKTAPLPGVYPFACGHCCVTQIFAKLAEQAFCVFAARLTSCLHMPPGTCNTAIHGCATQTVAVQAQLRLCLLPFERCADRVTSTRLHGLHTLTAAAACIKSHSNKAAAASWSCKRQHVL